MMKSADFIYLVTYYHNFSLLFFYLK